MSSSSTRLRLPRGPRPKSGLHCVACHGPMSIYDIDRKGRRIFICTPCKVIYYPFPRRRSRSASNVYCIACHIEMPRMGQYKGRQRYWCRRCKATCLDGKRLRGKGAELQCVACHGRMLRRGKTIDRERLQVYRCEQCSAPYVPERPPKVAPTEAVRRVRQRYATQLDARLLDIIKAALPGNLPLDLREDVIQESAVAALSGDFDLSELAGMVSHCRRRINRLSANRFQFVSLDQPIPNTNGLTFGDVIAG